MKTGTLLRLSAVLEAATGVALIAIPEVAARVLLGTTLSPSGIAVARVGGFALLSLGLSCLPGGEEVTPQAVRALFIYNLLAGVYLGYLRFGGGFDGFLLLPASILHALITLLMVRPAYKAIRRD